MACKRAIVSGDEGQTWGFGDDKLNWERVWGGGGRESGIDRPGPGVQGKVGES